MKGGSRRGVVAKLEISPEHYQGPFDNTLQRLKSKKRGKLEMKGPLYTGETEGQINSRPKIRPRCTDSSPSILSYHSGSNSPSELVYTFTLRNLTG